jgi:hypothetical protein
MSLKRFELEFFNSLGCLFLVHSNFAGFFDYLDKLVPLSSNYVPAIEDHTKI